MKSCSQHSLFFNYFCSTIFRNKSDSEANGCQRYWPAALWLSGQKKKERKRNTVCKLLEVIKDGIVLERQKVCHQSAYWIFSVFSGFRYEALALQRVAAGTAKITLVPESKDLHFPPGLFCETSAPVHPGQPRLLLCACTCVEVYVCVFALSLYCRETVEG